MKIFVNAKTRETAESISAVLEEFSAEVSMCYNDETADNTDLTQFDAIVVSLPLRSEFGLDFVARTSKRTGAPLIVLARADIAEDVQSRIRFTGAFVLSKPFTKSVLIQTVRMAAVAGENIARLRQEKEELSKQLEDVKIIDRAKCCLIEYLNLTENQAHRHIQKLAMDTRRGQREVAEDILRTYSGVTNV